MNTPITHNTYNMNNGGNGVHAAPTQATGKMAGVVPAKGAGAVPAPHHLRDVTTRLRDKWGNRLSWFFAYHTPTVSGSVLTDTAMRQALAVIRDANPFLASELEHFYDQRLVQASRALSALRESEDAKISEEQARTQAHNGNLEIAVEHAKRQGEERLAELDTPICAVHKEAGEAVAAIGGVYDPESPDAACVLGRVVRQDPAAVAGELRLPYPAAESKPLFPTGVKHAMTVTVGTLLGVSIGLASNLLPAVILKNPDLIATYAVPVVLFLAGGIAVAAGSKLAIYELSRQGAKRFWLGRSAWEWGLIGAAAVALTIGIIYLDACVEREGLMAQTRIQQVLQGDNAVDAARENFYLFLGMIVVIGYAVAALLEGYAAGQREACHLVITAEVEKRFAVADTAWRAKAEVQEALAAIAGVRNLLDTRGRIESQTAARIADLQAQKRAESTDLPEDAKRRIQEAHDQFVAAQDIFDAQLAAAKAECGIRRESHWAKVLRMFGVQGESERRHKREEKRNV